MQIKLSIDTSLWLRRLALYFSLYVLIIGSHLFFSRFDWWHTDVDSARYMLSALVQSEAAIVALVVTLSLVAVQLAASSYSARVIEVFRRTPDLWILMGIYGMAIFYGLGVLKMIENPLVGRMSNLEGHIAFSYYLGVFAFAALAPYMWKTLELLKPSTVIEMLSKKITKQNILDAIEEGEEKSAEKDPIQPIIDIVRGSLMKYDYETIRYGLKAIENRTKFIFKNETFEKDKEEKISEHIFAHLNRVGKQAGNRGDEDCINEIIYTLKNIGEIAIERKLEDAAYQSARFLGEVGQDAAKQRLEDVTQIASLFLRKFGEDAAEKKLKIVTQVVAVELGQIGGEAVEQKLKNAISQVAMDLFDVGIAAAEQKFEHVTWLAAHYLGSLGITASEQKLANADLVVTSLGAFGKEVAKQKIEKATVEVISSLGWIGEASAKQKLKDNTIQVAKFIEDIIKVTKEQNLQKASQEAADYLKKINEALRKI